MRDALVVVLIALIFYKMGVTDGYDKGWTDYEGSEIVLACFSVVATTEGHVDGLNKEGSTRKQERPI